MCHRKILEPIIIIHGYLNESEINLETNYDLILNTMKIIAINGYEALLKDACANDVVALTISELEEGKSMKATSIRGAILMNNKGEIGCVSALTTFDHPILLARRLLDENGDVTIIQENIEERQASNLKYYNTINNYDDKSYLHDIQNWGVIARDRNEKLAGGRSIWAFEEKKKPSINVMMSVPGCGLLVDDKSCCSVSGDEQMIYVYAPARKIIQRLKGVVSVKAIRKEINCFMKQNSNTSKAIVYLGANNTPLISCENQDFPWVYCYRGIMKYGHANMNESLSEKIPLNVALNCRCFKKNQII